jgi:hypothetical protein
MAMAEAAIANPMLCQDGERRHAAEYGRPHPGAGYAVASDDINGICRVNYLAVNHKLTITA